MNITHKILFSILSTLLFTLFYGCSTYTLQGLIDGDHNQTVDKSSQHSKSVAPSQNKALNSISPSTTASDDHVEYRYIQKSTNEWIENEWEPLTGQEENVTKGNISPSEHPSEEQNSKVKREEENSSFTLQHYVDKASVYMKNKKRRDVNKTKVPSHTEKINNMPVIGKSKHKR